MRKYIRGTALLLTVTMMVGMLAGCGEKKQTVSRELPEVVKQNVRKTIPETDIDFIKDGDSDYQIVIPENASENEQFAAEEIQYFTKEASGVELAIVRETASLGEGKYIFVGNTKSSQAENLKPAYETVKTNGFVIKQLEDDCYILGNYDIGTRNGAYEFLMYLFDYEYYAVDEIYLEHKENAKMLAFDLTEVPDFDMREVSDGETYYDETGIINKRRRFNMHEVFMNGTNTHNALTIIDPKKYDWKSEKYKFWYSNDGKEVTFYNPYGEDIPYQLCYSNDEMRAEFTKNLIEDFISKKSEPYMLLGAMDIREWCTCEKCAAACEKYGTDAAVIIWFINKVQADVDTWFAKNRPGEEPTRLMMFGYQKTVKPPVTYNKETKKYEPIDESVVLNEHSGVYFAPIDFEIDVPFVDEDSTDATTSAGRAKAWNAITKTIFCWTYSLITQHSLMYCDVFEASQRNYQFLKENGTVFIQDQGTHWMKNCNSGFLRLQTYVRSKVMWDTTLNMGELIDDFCDNYFGEASDTMQELFTQEREWMTHIYADTDATGDIFEQMMDEKFWNYRQLQGYLALIDQAYADIETLRDSNPERYEQLYNRILIESMQFRYIMICLFSPAFEEAELLEEKRSFRTDFEHLGMASHAEWKDIKLLWDDWGITDY